MQDVTTLEQVKFVMKGGDVVKNEYRKVKLLPKALAQKKRKAGSASRPFASSELEDYFLGAIASFAALATRNFTTVLALI